MVRLRSITCLLVIPFLAPCVSCARSAGDCEWEAWEGPCVLQSTQRTRFVERFPRSYVVIEALYVPADLGSIGAPPSIRVEHSTDARYEYDLVAHLKQNPNPRCSVHLLDEGVCGSPQMTAHVPAFQPLSVTKAQGPTGCALLDGAAEPNAAASEPIDEVLEFQEGAATATADIAAAIGRIAIKVTNDPTIQCIAISGQNAHGEEFRLADERARAVQQLLVERGVPAECMRVFAAVLPTYAGTSAMDRVADPEHRRVQLTIVAKLAAP